MDVLAHLNDEQYFLATQFFLNFWLYGFFLWLQGMMIYVIRRRNNAW